MHQKRLFNIGSLCLQNSIWNGETLRDGDTAGQKPV